MNNSRLATLLDNLIKPLGPSSFDAEAIAEVDARFKALEVGDQNMLCAQLFKIGIARSPRKGKLTEAQTEARSRH